MIAAHTERTGFLLPHDNDHHGTNDSAGLVQAAGRMLRGKGISPPWRRPAGIVQGAVCLIPLVAPNGTQDASVWRLMELLRWRRFA